MKNLLAALLLLAPFASHAQVVVNEPPTAEVGTALFMDLDTRGMSNGHVQAVMSDGHTSEAGAIFCDTKVLKANAQFGYNVKFGYFSFDSSEKCDEIAKAMARNPSTKVKFSVVLDPDQPQIYGKDYLYGKVTAVEWLK